MARAAGGTFVVRVEDLDVPRVVAGSAERILDDLAWLGLAPWEGPYVQSTRIALYERALGELDRAGRTYPCDCSRAEIAVARSAVGGARNEYSVASAPHEGEELVYPGTCRDADPARPMRRPPATRFRGEGVDDFVLRRGDGVFSYQLAVSVDDLAMAISCVVRGADLLSSTPRQLAIMRALGARDEEVPAYVHLPLVRDARGERISKRTAGGTVRALREGGISAREIVDTLRPATTGAAPFVIPERWASGAKG